MQPIETNAEMRNDPAPSRLSYRMQRWMLTPGIRLMLRVGVPFCLAFALGSAFLASEQRRDALSEFVSSFRSSIEERPEFMVRVMSIDGAGANLAEDIREVMSIDFPISQFDLDLEEMRKTISELDPVRSAALRIRPGGVLAVTVTERVPVAVWRAVDGLSLVDETGAHVDRLTKRTARPDLPLIAGEGAGEHVDEALALYSAARPLHDRLRGFLRMGERRWNVVLDRGQIIMLPEDGAVRALERVIALDGARDMLERDLAVVDMRIAERPTLRMNKDAVQDWWRIRQINSDR